MADVSKVNVNSTDYNIKDSNAMHKGVDRVTAGQSIIAPIGTASTADGFAVNASGDYSHASGLHTIASSDIQHVIGKYNEEDANGTYAFIVGGGRLDVDRKNIFTIDWNGDVNAGRSNGLTNDTKLPTGADVISYLNSNFANLMVKQFFNQSTFTIAFDYNASATKSANGIMINANQGLFALLRLDLSPAVTKISGSATITISATNTKTYTITASNTMWGNTTFIITHN